MLTVDILGGGWGAALDGGHALQETAIVSSTPGDDAEHSGGASGDNLGGVELVAAGDPLPTRTLIFSTAAAPETSNVMQKSYWAIPQARYGDNFIVAVHPNRGPQPECPEPETSLAESYQFRLPDPGSGSGMGSGSGGGSGSGSGSGGGGGASPQHVLKYRDFELSSGSGGGEPQWEERWKPLTKPYRTSILTIMPSVDIDTDSDNTGTLDRSDAEEEMENHPDHLGKRLFINWNDSNKNGIPDKDEMEGDTWAVYEAPDKDLVMAALDMGLTNYEGLAGYELVLHYPAHVRIWADQLRTPLSTKGAVPGAGTRTHTWTIGENCDPATLFPLEVFVEGIDISAAAVNWTLHAPGPDGQMLDTDAAKFSVEKIVWPSNETGDAWRSKATSDWNGFELPEGWYIEKSLEELIQPEAEIGEIRTGYPVEVPEDSGVWKGRNTVQRAFIDIDKALGLEDGATADSYRVVVHFSYEDGSPEHSQSHYVDIDRPAGHLIKPGFFANSGVFVDTVREIQIFDTASLNAAFDDGTTVTINGQDTLIKAVMGTPVLDQDDKPIGFTIDPNGSWVSLANAQGQVPDVSTWVAEEVSALITGIVYNVDNAYVNNWESEGGTEVVFNSKADLVAKPGEITIDVYRVGGNLNIKVTCGDTTYYYEGLDGGGNRVELQSHWASGVRFTGATVTAIPPGE